jgi:hypothetical protein
VFGWTSIRRRTAVTATIGLVAASAGLWAGLGSQAHAAGPVPTPDHTVVVVMENHAYSQVIGSSSAPYINNTLKAGGANLTQSFAITHPSQPNYYALSRARPRASRTTAASPPASAPPPTSAPR